MIYLSKRAASHLGFFSGLLFFWLATPAQNGDWILGHDVYHYVDRIDILGYVEQGIPTELKPYGRERVASWVKAVDDTQLSAAEQRWQRRMLLQVDDDLADSLAGRGLWGFVGTNRRDFYHIRQPGFRMYVNPVLHMSGGVDRNNDPLAAESLLPLFNNLRGIVIRGSVGEKIGFHTEAGDYLAGLPEFQYRGFRARRSLPGEEFVKPVGSVNRVNFFRSRAYLTAQAAPWLRVKFGKDRAHWGNGWQSLWLSDHASDALLLQLHASIWKLEYVTHIAQFIDYFPGKSDQAGDFPRKYGTFHALYYRPIRQVSIGIFESLMYSPVQPYGRRGLELQYFNPVIFYRSVEQLVGSPDNAMVGASVRANLWRSTQWYGQVAIDDLNFGNRVQGRGYWGNQWAVQLGFKYMNMFTIPTLDLQIEYNRVRPYVYQHFSVVSNYSHYDASLGHAAGANLQDVHAQLRYHPFPAWNLQLMGSLLQQGRSIEGKNYGWDPRMTYDLRPFEYGHLVGQGASWQVQQLWGRLSWQLGSSDVYLEAEGRYRRERMEGLPAVQSLSCFGGIRVAASPAQIRW